MGQAPAVDHRHSQVVDQLLLDQNVRVPDGIENFTDRQRRCRVLTNQPEALLQLRGHRVFEPEEMIRFETLPQPRCFDGSQSMVNIVK